VIKILETQVGQFLLGCKCPVSRGIVLQGKETLVTFPQRFPSKCHSIATAEMSNPPHRYFGLLEDSQRGGCWLDPRKSRREIFQRIFALGIFWGGVSRYVVILLIVPLSPGHSDISRFRP